MTAPTQTGTYNPRYQMVWDGHQWFGQTVSTTITVGPPPYNSAWVSDNIPGSVSAGSTTSIQVCFKNTGTQTWYTYPGAGSPLVGPSKPDNNNILAFSTGNPHTVPTGSQCHWYGMLYAPTSPGTYTVKYQLLTEGSWTFFGPVVNKTIVVT